jgi:hypothetical protein
MSDTLTVAVIGGLSYVAQKVFEPTLVQLGLDFKGLYIDGRNKLVELATKKVSNPDEKKIANLRAAHMIFWDGSLAALNNEFCAVVV